MESTLAAAPATEKASAVRYLLRSRWLYGYLSLYGLTLGAMVRYANFNPVMPLFIFGVAGIGLSTLAWFATRGLSPLPFPVREPNREIVFVAAYLPVVIAFLAWGLTYINQLFPAEPIRTLVITFAKLLIFVFIPALALKIFWGYGLQYFFPPVFGGRHHARAAVIAGAAIVLLQCFVGRGLKDIANAHLDLGWLIFGALFSFLWAALEAGLVEEFFFRLLLQTRLSAWLKSEIGAVVLMSLFFGLAHAPGFYLRGAHAMEGLGDHPSFVLAFGYSIVVTSVLGFFLGILWARTRNLWLVIFVHAAGDWLQGIVPAIQMFHK